MADETGDLYKHRGRAAQKATTLRRRSLAVEEEQAARQGMTLAQYLVLVQLKGMPGRSWALVGELAEALKPPRSAARAGGASMTAPGSGSSTKPSMPTGASCRTAKAVAAARSTRAGSRSAWEVLPGPLPPTWPNCPV